MLNTKFTYSHIAALCAADTGELPGLPLAAGLLAISLGLTANIVDDEAPYA